MRRNIALVGTVDALARKAAAKQGVLPGEGVAVASYVEDDFGVDGPGAFGDQGFERVRVLLCDGWPRVRGIFCRLCAHDPRGREGDEQRSAAVVIVAMSRSSCSFSAVASRVSVRTFE